MGVRGPVPKRSEDRVRRNKGVLETKKADASVDVHIPSVDGHWHPIAKLWYRSLRESGQSQFYESSDWAYAYFMAKQLSLLMEEERVNAAAMQSVRAGMNDLLTTEGARRRVQVELERAGESNVENLVAIDDYRTLYG